MGRKLNEEIDLPRGWRQAATHDTQERLNVVSAGRLRHHPFPFLLALSANFRWFDFRV